MSAAFSPTGPARRVPGEPSTTPGEPPPDAGSSPVRAEPAALIAGAATALGIAVVGGPGWALPAAAYLALVFGALRRAGLLGLQMVVGTGLVGVLLALPQGPGVLSALPLLVGHVATAELAGSARAVGPGGAAGVARAGRTALLSGGVFGAVALVAGLPGPGGLLAVGIASAACIGASALVVRAGS